MKTLIIIPTYNEVQNIQALITELFELSSDLAILVVDDHSPDQTADVIEKMQFTYPLLHLLKRKAKKGIGPAYKAGFKWAIEKEFDFVVQMDADFSHAPKDLVLLLEQAQNSDVVIGSRYITGGLIENWPAKRLWLSKMANHYARLMTGLKIQDTTAGFCLFKTSALKSINLDKILSNGYAFQIELKHRAHQKSLNIKEVPITFYERKNGESKMHKEIIFEALWNVFKLRFS